MLARSVVGRAALRTSQLRASHARSLVIGANVKLCSANGDFHVSRRCLSSKPTWKLGTKTSVGDAFPDVGVDIGFLGLDPSNKKTTGSLNAGKNTLWIGLPGAFTPT